MTSVTSKSTPTWIKCTVCGKVKSSSAFPPDAQLRCGECVLESTKAKTPRSDTERSVAARRVAEYRARTGGAYDKAYNKAVRLAMSRLRDAHPDEYGVLLAAAKKEMGI